MKKLTTLAVAAALVAPMSAMADTTIYGLIDNAVTSGDNSTVSNDDALDVRQGNGTSRFGVKGSEDLGNGLKAIFQYEWATATSEGEFGGTTAGFLNRLGYVGLAGSFGKVTVGRQWNPYYFGVAKTDIMNGPAGGYRQNLNHYRTGNGLGYATPNMNGFSAAIVLAMDADTGAAATSDMEDGVDTLSLNVKYDNGPLSLGLGYRSAEATTAVDDTDTWGLGAKYNFGNFAVMASYEDQDNGSSASDVDAVGIGAEAYFGNNTVKVLYTSADTSGGADTDAWAIGLQHSFSKRTRVYVEYADLDADTASGLGDMNEFSVGLRHDF